MIESFQRSQAIIKRLRDWEKEETYEHTKIFPTEESAIKDRENLGNLFNDFVFMQQLIHLEIDIMLGMKTDDEEMEMSYKSSHKGKI